MWPPAAAVPEAWLAVARSDRKVCRSDESWLDRLLDVAEDAVEVDVAEDTEAAEDAEVDELSVTLLLAALAEAAV